MMGPSCSISCSAPAGGEPVKVNVEEASNAGNPFVLLAIVTPRSPLAPDTSYEVLSRVQPDCNTDCITADHQVIATFTTGSDADTTPPTFEGATDVTVAPLETCDSEACCGP